MDKLDHPVLKNSGLDKISITDLTHCYYCNTSLDKIQLGKCSACGFPQLGTEVEQRKFLNEKRALKIKRDSYWSNAKMVRNMLFVVAFVFLFSYGLIFQRTELYSELLQGLIIVGLFSWLAIWSQKHPYKGILYGIYLFVGILAIYFLHDSHTLFAGYLFKLICIGALFYGWIVARSTEKTEKELSDKKIEF